MLLFLELNCQVFFRAYDAYDVFKVLKIRNVLHIPEFSEYGFGIDVAGEEQERVIEESKFFVVGGYICYQINFGNILDYKQ